MKRLRVALTMLLLLCVTAIQAQSPEDSIAKVDIKDVKAWHGLRFSFDRVYMSFDVEDYVGMKGMYGANLSYVHAFKLSQKLPLFIEVGGGLNFYQGSSYTEGSIAGGLLKANDRLTTVGLTIPVNLAYGF